MWKIIIGMTCIVLAQIMVFFQNYGMLKIDYLKENKAWLPYLLAIPCTFLFLHGTELIFNNISNNISMNRFISFSIGIVVFNLLNYLIFSERLNLVDLICILLSILIISLQIWNKTNSQT